MLVFSGQPIKRINLAFYKPSRGINFIYTKKNRTLYLYIIYKWY